MILTIGNIYTEFQKITTLGRPWVVIGGPWGCLEESFGALGASWGLIGAPCGTAKPNDKNDIKSKCWTIQ